MALYHDCYLFQPEEFAAAVVPHVEVMLNDPDGYESLRASAIRLFDHDPQVRELADVYGAWDRSGIETGAPTDQPQHPRDVAFWLLILLYKHLVKPEGRRLGLGNDWRLMEAVLKSLGWNDIEREMLVAGNDFKYLLPRVAPSGRMSFDSSARGLEYLALIQPFATAGQAGWIDYNDTRRLLEKLTKERTGISNAQIRGDMQTDGDSIESVYQAALEMLTAAEEKRSGLCMIVSG